MHCVLRFNNRGGETPLFLFNAHGLHWRGLCVPAHPLSNSQYNNALILTLLNSIVNLLSEQRKHIFTVEGGPQRGQIHHRHIIECVIRHDPTGARNAMHAHLLQVHKDINAV
jgi:hypothetical protein